MAAEELELPIQEEQEIVKHWKTDSDNFIAKYDIEYENRFLNEIFSEFYQKSKLSRDDINYYLYYTNLIKKYFNIYTSIHSYIHGTSIPIEQKRLKITFPIPKDEPCNSYICNDELLATIRGHNFLIFDFEDFYSNFDELADQQYTNLTNLEDGIVVLQLKFYNGNFENIPLSVKHLDVQFSYYDIHINKNPDEIDGIIYHDYNFHLGLEFIKLSYYRCINPSDLPSTVKYLHLSNPLNNYSRQNLVGFNEGLISLTLELYVGSKLQCPESLKTLKLKLFWEYMHIDYSFISSDYIYIPDTLERLSFNGKLHKIINIIPSKLITLELTGKDTILDDLLEIVDLLPSTLEELLLPTLVVDHKEILIFLEVISKLPKLKWIIFSIPIYLKQTEMEHKLISFLNKMNFKYALLYKGFSDEYEGEYEYECEYK